MTSQYFKKFRLVLCGLLLTGNFASFNIQAAAVNSTPPEPQNKIIDIGFDRAGVPANIYIWENEFGGDAPSDACANAKDCINIDSQNTLTCLPSGTAAKGGLCPVWPYWISSESGYDSITLEFKHSSGRTVDLSLTARKTLSKRAAWNASASVKNGYGFSVYIPAAELKKLSLAGDWKAELKMRVMAWPGSTSCNSGWDSHAGCRSALLRANWNASIILRVTDTGTQQIYFPAYPSSTPVVNLKLKVQSGKDAVGQGSTSLDMCLYDGSDSTRNQVSLIFSDEGEVAGGRPAGQFSVYLQGADKTKAANRVDYRVRVLNPTTGATQEVSNGKEIIWTNTNRRNIQRQVVLPGVPSSTWCVPAPITLITPEFKVAEKSAGRYRGILRIIYTPTTQSSPL